MRIEYASLLSLLCLSILILFTACGSDACTNVQCNNGGVCLEEVCYCVAGYEDNFCDVEMRSKFLNEYAIADTCDTLGTQYTCTISADDTEIIRVTFSNFANLDSLGLTNAIYGLVNGTALTIPEQTLLDRSYEGTGSIDELTGILTLSYTIRDTTGAKALINSCVAVYTP